MKILTKTGDIFTDATVLSDVDVAVGYSDTGNALYVVKQHGDTVLFMTADDEAFSSVLATIGMRSKLKEGNTDDKSNKIM